MINVSTLQVGKYTVCKFSDTKICVKGDTKPIKDQLKSITGRWWNGSEKVWTYPNGRRDEVIEMLRKIQGLSESDVQQSFEQALKEESENIIEETPISPVVRTIADDSSNWLALKRKIDVDVSTIGKIDLKAEGYRGYNRALFVTSLSGFMKRKHKNGETALIDKGLRYIKSLQPKLPKKIFADNNAIWQLMLPENEIKAEATAHEQTFQKIQQGEIKTPEDLGKAIVEDHEKEGITIPLINKKQKTDPIFNIGDKVEVTEDYFNMVKKGSKGTIISHKIGTAGNFYKIHFGVNQTGQRLDITVDERYLKLQENEIKLTSDNIEKFSLSQIFQMLKDSPSKDLNTYINDTIPNYKHLIAPNETVTARQLAEKIKDNYSLDNINTKLDYSVFWTVNTGLTIKNTGYGIQIKNEYDQEIGKNELKTPKGNESEKNYITLRWAENYEGEENRPFYSWESLQEVYLEIYKDHKEEIKELNVKGTYAKTKLILPDEIEVRVDVSDNEGDFNPNKQFIRDYLNIKESDYILRDSGKSYQVTQIIEPIKVQKPDVKASYQNDFVKNKAIEALIDFNVANGLDFTPDEKIFINTYSGYGGLQKFGATGPGIMTEYFTPDKVVEKMWQLAYQYGFEDGDSVLENSVGVGRFLKYVPGNSPITAYEINKYSFLICKILYPKITIRNIPYEKVFINDNNLSVKGKVTPKHHLVIGNPPYGNFEGEYSFAEKQYTKAANLTEYFITRSLDELLPGGLLIYIIGASIENGGNMFLDSGKTACKIEIANKADLIDVYRLGNKVFPYTDVLADIVVFRKK